MSEAKYKVCRGKNGCQLFLSLDNFYFDLRLEIYRSRCNACQKIYNQKWNQKNNLRSKENKKIHYLKNREIVLIRLKENYNTEKQKEKNKLYYKKNKEKLIKNSIDYERNRNKIDEIYKFKSIMASSIKSVFK